MTKRKTADRRKLEKKKKKKKTIRKVSVLSIKE